MAHQALETMAVVHLRARLSQVGIQHSNLLRWPAQLQGSVLQGILAVGALLVMIDLSHRRLAQINVGHLLAMVDLDLGVHGSSRCFELEPSGPNRPATSSARNWRRGYQRSRDRVGIRVNAP